MFDFKGAIFDLDGTLLDSLDIWCEIDIKFLKSRGLEVTPDYSEAVKPLGFREAAAYTIARFGLKETPEDVIREWHRMSIEAYGSTIPLKPYAKEFLIYLKSRGVKLATATASSEELFIPALKNNGIFDLFDAFVTISDVGRGKGFPDVYLKAAEKIGLPPCECAVFEDIYPGVKGAKDGNFYTVAVYDKHSEKEREKIAEISDLYIMDFGELFPGR